MLARHIRLLEDVGELLLDGACFLQLRLFFLVVLELHGLCMQPLLPLLICFLRLQILQHDLWHSALTFLALLRESG